MRALIEAASAPDFPAEIVGVISNRADAGGLVFAQRASIATQVIAKADFPNAAAQDRALVEALDTMRAEIICLAGYMRLLPASFVEQWAGRMVNIHPSLLPLFKGLHPHQQALEAGVRVHGCSVHFVTPEMDSGPLIAQAAVPVLANDTEDALTERVLKAEHRLYPLALRLLAEGKVAMIGERTIFRSLAERDQPALVSPRPDDRGTDLEALARSTP